MHSIARMRTVKQCVEYFKELDPETHVGEYYLRQLIKQGEIKCFMTGRKMLVNLDLLIEYFHGKPDRVKDSSGESLGQSQNYGKIRAIH